ncbi:MAG: thiamine phosphate synthase [Magnetococcales bacterium]|nr:thiamine phosphate synthase [Magnetococcales bacterium]
MKSPLPRLLLITDRTLCADLPVTIAAALAGGVRHVLLREKGLPEASLLRLAQELQGVTAAQGAFLLIHERVDLALAIGAHGVHLPEHGLATAEARRLLAGLPAALLGRSCHSVAGACQALQEGADFVTLSPLFATLSHPDAPPLGVNRFAAMRASIPGPVLALGGIHRENARTAMQTGAYGIALIRGVLDTPDPCQTAAALLREISQGEDAL